MKRLWSLLLLAALLAGCGRAPSQEGEQPSAPGENSSSREESASLTPSQLPDACGIVQLSVEITTPEQLVELSRLVASGDREHSQVTYRLGADLDLSGIDFAPIGGAAQAGQSAPDEYPVFDGILDGQGHTICNLTISRPQGEGVGLVGLLGPNGIVRDLTLQNFQVEGRSSVGSLVGGSLGGLIQNCLVQEGGVTGVGSVGGLVGSVSSREGKGTEVVTSAAWGVTVTGNREVGGFVGTTSMSQLSNCGAAALSGRGEVRSVFDTQPLAPGETKESLAAQEFVLCDQVDGVEVKRQMGREIGGFVGSNNGTQIVNCRAALPVRTVDASGWVGSFAGYSQGDLMACAADSGSGWRTVGASGGNALREVARLSANQMLEEQSYPGWDFENTWAMDPERGPVQRVFLREPQEREAAS